MQNENLTAKQAINNLQQLDHHVAFEKAATMVKRFKTQTNLLHADNQRENKNNLPVFPTSLTFNKAAVLALLSDADCVGLRIYPAINDNNSFTTVLLGVNKEGDNIFVPATANNISIQSHEKTSTKSAGLDEAQTCPPYPLAKNDF